MPFVFSLTTMQYVDEINMEYGGEGTRLYSTAGTKFKKLCLQNRLQLLNASVRHLGTDVNYIVLQNMYAWLKDRADFYFDTPVQHIEKREDGYQVICEEENYACGKCVVSVGRSKIFFFDPPTHIRKRLSDILFNGDHVFFVPVFRIVHQQCIVSLFPADRLCIIKQRAVYAIASPRKKYGQFLFHFAMLPVTFSNYVLYSIIESAVCELPIV